MTEHPNAQLVRGLFAAFGEHDIDAVRNALSEEAVWHFPGREGQLAGDHAGHEGIFGFLARVSQLTEGTFDLDLEEVLASDGLAVAFFRGHGRRQGRELSNPTCLKIRIEEGRAVEIWEFVWDLYEVDHFWSE